VIDPHIRSQGIGCSELAAIQGMSRWHTAWEIAMRKRGLLLDENDHGTPEQAWGHDMEPAILRAYTRLTKRSLIVDHVSRRHPDVPLVYTPDALVEGERRGVDAKNVGFGQADDWRGPEPPADAFFQCVGYMFAMDLDAYDLAVSICGASPVIWTVTRDGKLEQRVVARVTNFWNRFVAGEEELPIDGSAAATAYLERRYPRNKLDLRNATSDEVALLQEYETLRIAQNGIEAGRDELENKLRQAIGDHDGLRWSGGRLTWKRTRDRKTVRWESMAIALRQQFIKDEQERERLLDFYTDVKPGYRKLDFRSVAYKAAKEAAAA
jgi:predicted phage-related endonuclease